MKTIRQGATGAAVADAQGHINAHGFGPLAVDRVFGPRTAAAVRDLQASVGLVVDGVIGPRTWAELEGRSLSPSGAHVAEARPDLEALAELAPLELERAALRLAVACLGRQEDPRGSNLGDAIAPFVADWYSPETLAALGQGPAWCALFLSWCAAAGAAGVDPGPPDDFEALEPGAYRSGPFRERISRACRAIGRRGPCSREATSAGRVASGPALPERAGLSSRSFSGARPTLASAGARTRWWSRTSRGPSAQRCRCAG